LSSEPITSAREPVGARVVPGDLDGALERLVAQREELAAERGRRAAEAELHASIGGAVDAAVERLDAAREEAIGQLNHTAVELAIEITRRLLRVELPAGRYDLEGIVREALAFSGVARGRCVVHLNPVDAAALANVPFRSGTEVEPDPTVPRGSAHITTPQGLLVRDLEEALRSIGERLLGEQA
jgi:flagellar biosynthesis/type III secretory pathway protein FliH